MSSLPEEIHTVIFLRLPVKSTLVCKSVSKNLYALISNPSFVKMHHNLTIQKTNFSFIVAKFDSSNLRNVICSVSYDPPSLSSNEFHLYGVEIDSPGSLDFDIQFMDSCNGLVWFWSDQREFFGLWNPNNNEYKELPKSPNKPVDQNTFAYAFGYDCDYKLICLYDNDDDGSLVDVYTMGPNSWKNSTQVVLYEISIDGESAVEAGVLANGLFHWLGNRIHKLSLSYNLFGYQQREIHRIATTRRTFRDGIWES